MTIRDIDRYVNNLWDWGFLDDCFGGTRIRVTDLDGIVERNGHFLVLECKSHDAQIPRGQAIMFEKMAATQLFTIFVIWGEQNRPERMRIIGKNGTKDYAQVDIEDVRKFTHRWYSVVSDIPDEIQQRLEAK
jgi:hypothetical protein